MPSWHRQLGAAGVEYVALVMLLALAAAGVVATLAVDGPGESGLALERAVARKQRCAVNYPRPCWEDPLTEAYGRSVAGAVRALAPSPESVTGPGGLDLVPVDFRRCRSASCAVPLPGSPAHLTTSNRRTAAFTSIRDDRRAGGELEIDYWLYRPTIGWERVTRRAGSATAEGLAATPLPGDADPVLVPLETLIGRDLVDFAPGEEPPWRGQVETGWAG
jgi:hypothetical protein